MGRWDYIGSERDELGSQIGSLQRQVNELTDAADKLTGSNVDIPQVDTAAPGFPVYRKDTKRKGGVFVTLRFLIPGSTTTLRIRMVRGSDRTDQATFNRSKFFFDIDDITVAEQGVGAVEREIAIRLEYGTLYHIFKLQAFADDPTTGTSPFASNPAADVSFNPATDVPLYQFTTPDAFGLPSDPSLTWVTINRLDPVTKDVYDAEIERVVFAPLSDTGAAQSWGASGADIVHAVLTLDGEVIDPKPHVLTDNELTQVADGASGRPLSTPPGRGYVKIRNEGLVPARIYSWLKNVCYVNGQKKSSSGAAVSINAANLGQDPALIGSPTLIITQTDPNTPKSAAVDLQFTQPSPPVGTRWVRLRRKLQGAADATYVVVTEPHKLPLQQDDLATPGTKLVRLCQSLKFKPSSPGNTIIYTLECTIDVRGGGQRIFTQDVTTGVNPDVPTDTALPSSLGTPLISFTPKVGVTISGMTVGANWNQPTVKELAIFEPAGPTFFDLPTYMSTAGASGGTTGVAEAAAKYKIGVGKEHVSLGITLAALKAVLGPSATAKARFYATNAFGGPTTSPDAAGFSIAGAKDFVNSKHSVNAITGGATAVPGKQVLINPDFLVEDSPGSGIVNRWRRWDGATWPIFQQGATAGNDAPISPASVHVRWEQAIDAIKFIDVTQWVVFDLKLGRIMPGVKFSLTFQAKANISLSGMILRVYFKHNSNSGIDNLDNVLNNTLVYVEIPLTGLNTSFQEFGGLLKVKDTPTIDDGAGTLVHQILAFQLVGTLGANTVWFDKFMFNRGTQPASFAIQESEEGQLSYIPNPGTAAGAPAQADIPNLIGTDGGWRVVFGDAGPVQRSLL